MANTFEVGVILRATGRAFVRGMRRVRQAARDAFGSVRREADKTEDSMESLTGKTRGLAGAFQGFAGTVRGLAGAAAGAFFVNANRQAETLQRTFLLLEGTAEGAANQMLFVRSAAEQLGQSVEVTGRAWAGLAAAVQGTSLEGEQAEGIFLAVSNAMSRLGKSSAETEGALIAIQQIISKGTVSAEELRGQLGERLPGAFQAAARSIGVTTEELGKLLETGSLTAEQLLPALTQELNRLYDTGSRVEGLTASWNRFTNAVTNAAVTINENTGATDLAGRALESAATPINALSVGFTQLKESLSATGTSLAEFLLYLRDKQSFQEFKKNSQDAFDAATESVAKTADSTFALDANLSASAKSAAELAKAVEDATGAQSQFNQALEQQGTENQQEENFKRLQAQLATLTAETFPEYLRSFQALAQGDALAEEHREAIGAQLIGLQLQWQEAAAGPEDYAKASQESLDKVVKTVVDGVPTFSDGIDNIVEGWRRAGEAAAVAGRSSEDAIRQQEDSLASAVSENEIVSMNVDQWIEYSRAKREANRAKAQAVEVTDQVTESEQALSDEITIAANLTGIVRQRYAALSQDALEFFDAQMAAVRSVRQWWTVLSDREFERVQKRTEDYENSMINTAAALRDGTATAAQFAIALASTGDELTHVSDRVANEFKAAVEAAKAEVDALNDALTGNIRRLQDELDRLQGNTRAIAERDYQEERLRYEEQYQQAVRAGDIDAQRRAQEALALLQQVHAIRMQQYGQELQAVREINAEAERPLQPGNRLLPYPLAPIGLPAGLPPGQGVGGSDQRLPARLSPPAVPEGVELPPITIRMDGQKVGELAATHLLREGRSTQADFSLASISLGAQQ